MDADNVAFLANTPAQAKSLEQAAGGIGLNLIVKKVHVFLK